MIPKESLNQKLVRYNFQAKKPNYSKSNNLEQKGKVNGAKERYQKAIELAPHREEVRQSLTKVENKFQEKNANNHLTILHYKLGKILAERREWDEAIACYRKAIEVDPNFADVCQSLGDALVETGKKEEAIGVYQKAIEIEPSLWEVHHKLGSALQEVGQFDEAVGAYQKSIELKSDFCWSFNNLGDVLVKLEKWEEAAAAYRQAVELNPDFAWGHYKLGDVLVELEDWEGAIAAYRQGVAMNPQAPWSLYQLGQLLRQQGKFEEAVRYLRQAVEIKADVPEFYLGLGAALVKLERWSEAEDYLFRVVNAIDISNSHLAEAYYCLGVAQSEQEQWSKAVEYYRESLALNPGQGECCLSLAEALGKLERWSEAVEYYRRAMLLSGQSGDIVFRLGQALEQLQKWAESVKVERKLDWEAEKKEGSQGDNQNYQKVSIKEAKITLFMPYYKAKHQERQDELVYCLKKNIECDEIDKIVLMIDDDHVPEIRHCKIEIVKIAARPTYLDWVELTETNGRDRISILANSDIYFDESIGRIREIFDANPHGFVALTRYEKEGTNQRLHENPHWSQDVWAVFGEHNFTKSFKNYLKIPLGVPRCDNKIAYSFAIHGAKVYNPCHYIKTVHVQESQLRYYDKYGDTTVLGGTAWVYPSALIGEPSKLQIDVWTLNSSDVAGVQINKKWHNLNKASQKEQAKTLEVETKEKTEIVKGVKNVIGFDSDWQYPVITEKYAYEMAHKFLINDKFNKNVVYFGFPWATLIDKLFHNQDKTEANLLMEKLMSFKSELQKYKRVITVCQQIRMLQFEYIFNEVGITDIFWPHTTKEQKVLPSYPHISLHPFPLYPVQAVDFEETNAEKKYLYSFVGTRPSKSYLTDSRNNIINYLSGDKRGLIKAREQWHYNKIVYDYQVLKRVKETNGLLDKSASEEFKEVMNQSVFALCPSGSGPNSIRLWEAIGFGVIPVVLSDAYLPPGELTLWDEATVTCPETLEDIMALPERLAQIQKDDELVERKRRALAQVWMRYGPDCFVYDIIKLFAKYASGDLGMASLRTTPTEGLLKPAKTQAIASKQLTKEDFKPSYTWPNPTFPFRLYYDSPKCRIFIIENIQHNWNWMAECHKGFRKTDFFFVMAGWYQSPSFAKEAEAIFSVLNLDKSQFFFMYNSPLEMQNFAEKGFRGDVINQNAWLDENAIAHHGAADKIYDAIYVEFNKKSKRPELAGLVSRLALVTRTNHGKSYPETPQYQYINKGQLSPKEMYEKISQSYCGLILSAEEGTCSTSSEYLLCGVPVVSTSSKGGRDVWYNEDNSIICEPTADGVALAVQKFVENPPDAGLIRQKHIIQAQEYRTKFIQVVADVFNRFGVVDVAPSSYFKQNFYHRMRKSENINFVKSLFIGN